MSETTKKQRTVSIVTFWLGILLTVVPSMVFVIQGFVRGNTQEKVCIGFTGVVALLIGIYMLLAKVNLKRTIFWIVMFGMISLFDKLGYMFIIMGVCNIIDEIIVTPIHRRYKEDYHTNKQIDNRIAKREKENAGNNENSTV